MSHDVVHVLLVEDRSDEADLIRLFLSRSQAFQTTVMHVSTLAEAVERLTIDAFDIVLLDLGLPDNEGVEAVKRLYQASPSTPIFVLTGDDRRETGLAAISAGAQDYLPKQHMVGRLLAQMAEHCIARQRRLRSAELRSQTDELTNIGNRRGCDVAFQTALQQRTGTGPGDGFAVSLIDIDNFKTVNDQFGHAVGDDVIKSIANELTGAIGDRGEVYRYGGEEFVALIWESDLIKAAAIVDELRSRCDGLFVPGHSHQITISTGVAPARRGETKRDVFERADAALYAAKEGGRNQTLIHDGTAICVPATIAISA